MPKTIFVALPLASSYTPDVLRALTEAASAVSGVLNDRIDIVGPEFGPAVPHSELLTGQIAKADLLVADLSGQNPNVMLEVGFAQALRKPILPMARDSGDVPFNLRHVQVLLYDPGAPSYLVPRLVEALESFLVAPSLGKPRRLRADERVRTVFISYSHADVEYMNRILIHLRPLEKAGLIDPWSDTKVKAGDQWREEIRRAVKKARVAVLLVSADFLASEFIVTDELPPLLVAAEQHGTRILPVVVKPSRFLRDATLSRFQAVNDPKKPVISMNEAEREDLYARLAEIIESDVQSAPGNI